MGAEIVSTACRISLAAAVIILLAVFWSAGFILAIISLTLASNFLDSPP